MQGLLIFISTVLTRRGKGGLTGVGLRSSSCSERLSSSTRCG
ncbi:21401_t:CDS:1, partial [Gigaspora rosea]